MREAFERAELDAKLRDDPLVTRLLKRDGEAGGRHGQAPPAG
jgi:hypothetical protein